MFKTVWRAPLSYIACIFTYILLTDKYRSKPNNEVSTTLNAWLATFAHFGFTLLHFCGTICLLNHVVGKLSMKFLQYSMAIMYTVILFVNLLLSVASSLNIA